MPVDKDEQYGKRLNVYGPKESIPAICPECNTFIIDGRCWCDIQDEMQEDCETNRRIEQAQRGDESGDIG